MTRRKAAVSTRVKRVPDLATRIVEAAVHLDRHGYLPDGWANVSMHPATREVPVAEIDARSTTSRTTSNASVQREGDGARGP
jgi:hypothetical protein